MAWPSPNGVYTQFRTDPYEPEGFQLGSLRYLPDFFLPNGLRFADEREPRQNIWIEIKPNAQLENSDRQKIAQFVKQTGYSLLLIEGEPGEEARLRFITYEDQKTAWNASDVKWTDLSDQELGLLNVESLGQERGDETRTALNRLTYAQQILAAFSLAKQARFEHTDSNSPFAKNGTNKTCESCGTVFVADQLYYRLCYSCYKLQRDERAVVPAKTENVSTTPATIETSLAPDVAAPSFVPRQLPIVWTRIGFGALVLVLLLVTLLALRATRNNPDTFNQVVPTLSVESTEPNPLATQRPISTPMSAPTNQGHEDQENRIILPDTSPCICTENTYNCRDFDSSAKAQACFDYCLSVTGDIHELDRDGDKKVCEPTPTPVTE